MRAHVRQLPRSVRVAGALMLVVPVALWLLLVWHTRPYATAEIEADRTRVEALPAYEQAVEECGDVASDWGDLGLGRLALSSCEQLAFAEHTSITREGLTLDTETSLWVSLSLAALVFVIGTRWPSGTGVRGLLARSAQLFLLGAVSTFAICLAWWWGLESIAEHRRLEDTDGPQGVALRASVLCGLAGVVGLACTQLLRGPTLRIVTTSVTAVALGLVLLIAQPVAPWLPVLNVRAFLGVSADYDIPRDQMVCTPFGETRVPLSDNLVSVLPFEYCTPDHRTRTGGEAAVYLLGTTLLLLSAATLTRARRRSRARPSED